MRARVLFSSSCRRSTCSTPAMVEPELGRQPVDQAQALDVSVGVEARPTGRAPGPDEAFRLVHPQRLRVHADEVGGDRDHVARTVGHLS